MSATLLEEHHELECEAFNAAFRELGLAWHWSPATLAGLPAGDDEEERVRVYIERVHPHLLSAYAPGFLAHAILERKNARLATLREQGHTPLATRHGVLAGAHDVGF